MTHPASHSIRRVPFAAPRRARFARPTGLRSLHQLFDDAFSVARGPAPRRRRGPPLDVRQADDGTLHVHLPVPGVRAESIDVTLENGVLSVLIEPDAAPPTRENETGVESDADAQAPGGADAGPSGDDERVVWSERPVREEALLRTLRLPDAAVGGEVRARVRDGVLLVTIDPPEETRPRRIQITTA